MRACSVGPLLCVAVVAAASERANLCFTSHSKTSLQCTQPLASDGPIAVYDDTQSPQKARTLYYKSGKLCDGRKCKRCMTVGGAWVPCGSARPLPVNVMGANRDWARPAAVLLAAAIVAVPVLVFTVGGKQAAPAKKKSSNGGAAGIASGVVAFLLRFAGAWWFPLVPAFGTALNMFTIVFTAATVVIFLAALLGQPRKWPITAVANAAGATLGAAVLLVLVRERGLGYLNETFPVLLASPAWAKATSLMTSYGVGGMFVVSCLPIILHPVIAFGMLGGMSNSTILAIVFCGRTVKYLIMGYVTVNVPSALRFFGIKANLVEYATEATRTTAK